MQLTRTKTVSLGAAWLISLIGCWYVLQPKPKIKVTAVAAQPIHCPQPDALVIVRKQIEWQTEYSVPPSERVDAGWFPLYTSKLPFMPL